MLRKTERVIWWAVSLLLACLIVLSRPYPLEFVCYLLGGIVYVRTVWEIDAWLRGRNAA